MTTCPTCGQDIDDGWIEYYCSCGCGIGCLKTDPKANEKIEAWKARHKCGGKK